MSALNANATRSRGRLAAALRGHATMGRFGRGLSRRDAAGILPSIP
ncbi:MAG: hypothetical protein R3B40_31130 [Polyangiales bacterium]